MIKRENGTGSIWKEKNCRKPWRVRITTGYKLDENNKKKAITVNIGRFMTRAEANEALDKFLRTPFTEEDRTLTFSDVYKKFYEYQKRRLRSQSTLDIYDNVFKHSEILWSKNYRKLRTEHYEKVLNDTSMSFYTTKRVKNILVMINKYAVDHNLTDQDYVSRINIEWMINDKEKQKNEKKTTKHIPFDQSEIDILWQNINVKNVKIILIMIYTGIRSLELYNIKKKDVHFDENYLEINVSKTKNGIRVVPIHNKIKDLIKYYYEKSQSEYLFDKKGQKLNANTFKYIFRAPLKKIGIYKHFPHDTRHTFATRWQNQGLNELKLIKIIGHSPKGITNKVYVNFNVKELNEELQKLN